MSDDVAEAPAPLPLPTVVVTDGCPWNPVYADCGGECEVYDRYEDPEAAQALWEAVASDLLWNWTNQVFGVCSVEVRPCQEGCENSGWSTYWGRGPGWDPGFPSMGTGPRGGASWYPVLISGQWHNVTCGCAGTCKCSPSGPAVLALPGPVQSVSQVLIDGQVVPPSAYRVADKRYLVRTDGDVWPKCQDMNKPAGPLYEPVVINNPTNTMTVTRSGQLVQILVEPTTLIQGGNFSGTLPWTVRSASQTSLPTGVFVLSTGSKNVTGSSGPGFAPFRVVYETSDAPDPLDLTDTFEVTYQKGIPVPIGGQIAVGRLACELAMAACGDEECALPDSMVSLSRQGVSMNFQDLTQVGTEAVVTGIRSIDWWVNSVTQPATFASVRSFDTR